MRVAFECAVGDGDGFDDDDRRRESVERRADFPRCCEFAHVIEMIIDLNEIATSRIPPRGRFLFRDDECEILAQVA